jgi:hypothetical protein
MVLTFLVAVYATMSFCYCIKEWASPHSGDMWLFDILFAPYYIIADAIHEYKEWRKPAEYPNETQYIEKFLPPDDGEVCWQEGSQTFTRKEVSDMLHTQRAMISNDLKKSCGDDLTDKMFSLLKNPRVPKF